MAQMNAIFNLESSYATVPLSLFEFSKSGKATFPEPIALAPNKTNCI
jgi:hypothetical protein